MSVVADTKRRVVELTFSRDFESLLLNYPSSHESLTFDLELAIQRGLSLLSELEDVHDLQHVNTIKQLVVLSNNYSVMESGYFEHWKLPLSEDLLDEIDLLILAHGADLEELGLKRANEPMLVMLLAVAGCLFSDVSKLR